jgi:hypothetical protein
MAAHAGKQILAQRNLVSGRAVLCTKALWSKEGRVSFLKKRSKKTFVCWVPRLLGKDPSGHQRAGAKVFCFFFSKNKTFFLSCRSKCCGAAKTACSRAKRYAALRIRHG